MCFLTDFIYFDQAGKNQIVAILTAGIESRIPSIQFRIDQYPVRTENEGRNIECKLPIFVVFRWEI